MSTHLSDIETAEERHARAQRDNPDHPHLKLTWAELTDAAKAGWQRIVDTEKAEKSRSTQSSIQRIR